MARRTAAEGGDLIRTVSIGKGGSRNPALPVRDRVEQAETLRNAQSTTRTSRTASAPGTSQGLGYGTTVCEEGRWTHRWPMGDGHADDGSDSGGDSSSDITTPHDDDGGSGTVPTDIHKALQGLVRARMRIGEAQDEAYQVLATLRTYRHGEIYASIQRPTTGAAILEDNDAISRRQMVQRIHRTTSSLLRGIRLPAMLDRYIQEASRQVAVHSRNQRWISGVEPEATDHNSADGLEGMVADSDVEGLAGSGEEDQ